MNKQNRSNSWKITQILRLFFAILVAFAGLLCVQISELHAGPQLILGTGNVDSEKPRRAFLLRSAQGETFGDQDMLGHFTLIYFGYTSCPDVCPTSLLTMAEVLDALGDDQMAITPLFITVDPKRDTPTDLMDYTQAFHDRIIGLTGPQVMIDAAVDAFNARYKYIPSDDNDPDAYAVDHTASLAFLGPNGRIITRFGYGKPLEEIVQRVKQELASEAKLVAKLKSQAKQ